MFGVCWNIVSAVSFGKRVETYKTKGRVKNFQYIDSFSVLTVDDKQSAHLKSQLVQPRDTFQDSCSWSQRRSDLFTNISKNHFTCNLCSVYHIRGVDSTFPMVNN